MNLTRHLRLFSRRRLTVAALLAVASAMTTGPAAARSSSRDVRRESEAKPVIVLVHGAWADATSWEKVVLQLQDDGFTVFAPPNTLRGLPQDSDHLRSFLTQNAALEGRSVVLVAHSYGGAVATNAAVGVPQVKALVYVDAFIPDEGETIGQLAASEPGSCLLAGSPSEIFTAVPYPDAPSGDVDLYIRASVVPDCFASGLPAHEAAAVAAVQRPLTAGSFERPSGPAAWRSVPSWAVVGTEDRVIPPAALTFMAKRAGARITEADAGHLSMISRPETVVGVIEDAARAVG